VKKVELADELTYAIVVALLIDEDHQPRLQVGEEKAEQESRHDEEHQAFLIAKGIYEGDDAECSVPHACRTDSNERVVPGVIMQFV
jgi:hypothetical protein